MHKSCKDSHFLNLFLGYRFFVIINLSASEKMHLLWALLEGTNKHFLTSLHIIWKVLLYFVLHGNRLSVLPNNVPAWWESLISFFTLSPYLFPISYSCHNYYHIHLQSHKKTFLLFVIFLFGASISTSLVMV